MRYAVIICLLACMAPAARCRAAAEADIYGYFEPSYTGLSADDYSQVSANKLRTDLRLEKGKMIFEANVNMIQYNGRTRWNALDFVPGKLKNSVPEEYAGNYVFEYEDEIVLDNAMVKLPFKYADLTLGKQQVALGTGYVWNPTDIFNKKDIIDPSGEQPGHNLYRAYLPVYSRYGLVVIYGPGENDEDSCRLLRLKGGAGHFDYSFIGIRKRTDVADYVNFSTERQKRELVGADLAGELLGLGVWGEYAYNYIDGDPEFSEWVSGADYTLKSGVYMLAEYYRNSSKSGDKDGYTAGDWLGYVTGESKSVSRSQLYVTFSCPAADLVTVGTSVAGCPDDGSLALIPTMLYSMYENVELEIFLNFNMGEDDTAFDSSLGSGGLARLRVYY
ncbi:MAG: hypothetical protein JXJ19_10150 [Elusimicrobia bacterium]|nr:hypothetical protein [Elusimicrobiota bacterium]